MTLIPEDKNIIIQHRLQRAQDAAIDSNVKSPPMPDWITDWIVSEEKMRNLVDVKH